MKHPLALLAFLMLVGTTCREAPAPWEGPTLTEPRAALTRGQLTAGGLVPLVDMSFFARPDWAGDAESPFRGRLSLGPAEMTLDAAWSAEGGRTFPEVQAEFISHGSRLFPRQRGPLPTEGQEDRYWEVILGTGAVWQEAGDGGWTRASFPLSLLGRYVGEVRNCVATFVYTADAVSNVSLQCSQETAVLEAGQVGDIRASIPASFEPVAFADEAEFLAAYERLEASRIPIAALSEIDVDGEIAAHFDRVVWTNSSTSLGAVYLDGTLYLHPPRTRHGTFPYPEAMRHGVFSGTKSMAGALAMFYFAERYGEGIFEEQISDYVPALSELPEWQGVTFSHALNMVTGTRAGEGGDLLYEPLELAPNKETAIANIAAFGDYPEAPGEKFNYATTNTFVLSYALQNYAREREGSETHYWDLVMEGVLRPIGADDFGLLPTRDADPADAVPILGLGGYPTLGNAARIARLIHEEGQFQGAQLLNQNKIREALGRTGWEGYPAWSNLSYRHSLWSQSVRAGGCGVPVSYMEGLGDNRVILFPSGLISFQFTDEFDRYLPRLVRAVEGIRSSCEG